MGSNGLLAIQMPPESVWLPVTVLLISLLVSSFTSYRLLSSISFPSLLVHTVTDDGFSSRLASFLLFFQEKNLLPAPPIQVHE